MTSREAYALCSGQMDLVYLDSRANFALRLIHMKLFDHNVWLRHFACVSTAFDHNVGLKHFALDR